jgi:hypothetical protein
VQTGDPFRRVPTKKAPPPFFGSTRIPRIPSPSTQPEPQPQPTPTTPDLPRRIDFVVHHNITIHHSHNDADIPVDAIHIVVHHRHYYHFNR